jgi:O-antigen/teichoic acid export membrane protein
VKGLATLGAAVAVDQLSFAGAHLALNLLLARWLAPSDYGTFAQVYALLLVGLAFHSALVTEPLLVHGRRSFAGAFERYLGVILCGHTILSIAFAAALVSLLPLASASAGLRYAADAVAIGAPVLLLVPLLRRACSVRMAWAVAASGGVVYAVALVGQLTLAEEIGHLSVRDAFACLASASILASAWIALRLGCRPRFFEAGFALDVVRKHWQYGRWALLAVLATWVPWNLHYLVLTRILSLEDIGGLRALQNLMLPTTHLSIALCTALLPILAADLAQGRVRQARALILRHLGLCAAANVCYVAVVACFGDELLVFLYGGAYAQVHPLAVQVVAIQAPWSLIAALALAQQALGQSARAFLLWLPHVGLSLAFGVSGATLGGVDGFVSGMLLASCLSLPFAWAIQRRWLPWGAPA